jgi:2-isopropylmalate synthase
MSDYFLYDTTLRDGTQTEDVSYTVENKIRISQLLDDVGIAYIEGGWPGSNPRDREFFERMKKVRMPNAKLVAFGMTARPNVIPSKDKQVINLASCGTNAVALVAKSWDFHVSHALKTSLSENIRMIERTIRYLKRHVDEVFFDAEHFFDGFMSNPDYALETVLAAENAGADWLILCDTNGGAIPYAVEHMTQQVRQKVKKPIGMHMHNDGDLAVANSLAGIRSGATLVQGTINGFGERCGNADLISLAPLIGIKLGFTLKPKFKFDKLTHLSHTVYELANMQPYKHQPYAGASAFAHKGGMHVSAVAKNPRTYEHIQPELVGNTRRVLVSDLAGKSNILVKAQSFGINVDSKDKVVKKIVDRIKELENYGFLFEGAEASFELLMNEALGNRKSYFKLHGFRVIDSKRQEGEPPYAEATIKVEVDGQVEHTAANGNGPVNALDRALRKALEKFYPQLKSVELIDYKVRVLTGGDGTGAKVRVLIESSDGNERWGTVGVSDNIIEASWQALVDSIEYKLSHGGSAKKGKKSNERRSAKRKKKS